MMFLKIVLITLHCLFALSMTVRQDHPWSVSLAVSDKGGSEYEGEVEILVVFKDGVQQAATLPPTRYRFGQTYTFQVHLPSGGPLQAAYIRTKGICPLGLLPATVLRLRQVKLASKTTSFLYTKETGDLAIKDACQNANSRGTGITDFSESTSGSFCAIDGQTYEDGQKFDMGCAARCKCENGSVACVDMCGTVAWEPHRKCHFVRVPGQCCDRVLCEEDAQTKSCAEAAPGDMVDDKGVVALHRYPWAVMFCRGANCTQIHAGAIVGSRHILTFAMDLSNVHDLFVSSGKYITDQLNASDFTAMRVSNVSSHPDFGNKGSVADSASRLQLVELHEPFAFTKELQAANLPFDNNHCSQLSKGTCPIMSVGWDLTDDSVKEIREWFFHADLAKRSDLCQKGASGRHRPGQNRRGAKRACVGDLIRKDCTGPLGGTVVATAAKTDFLVGLMDPDAALFQCEHPGTADVLPLCAYIDWVNNLTKESYE